MITGLVVLVLTIIGAVRVLKLALHFARRTLARMGRALASLDGTVPDAIAAIAKQRKVRS